jgi:hypothetical protein
VKYPIALLLLPALTLPGQALEIRAYSAATHDRFMGWPPAPVMNPTFLFDSTKFTGVGWSVNQPVKQFTAVSPKHFVYANHFKPAVGHFVKFLGSDGVVIQRTITALTTIPTDTTGDSDVALATLDAALPATVKPLPYLNLASEMDYEDEDLMVFGFSVKAGSGTLLDFDEADFDNGGPNGPTKVFTFEYLSSGTDPDDCYFTPTGGDSGSPSFILSGAMPALVGIHGGVIPTGSDFLNFDSFIPHYVPKLDLVLAPAGYRMRPAVFTPTTLAFASASTPSVLESGAGGSIDFTVENSGAATTGNLAVTLSFAPSEAPSGISASGCVVESLSAGVWSVRKALVAAAEEIVITAAWTAVPNTSEFMASVTVESDTTSGSTYPLTIPVAQTYASWSQDLTQTGEDDDPDSDGWVNLLEYAFGSSGASGVFTLPGGNSVRPVMANQGGTVTLSFPERTQAALLGLTYQVELTANVTAGPWATPLPVGTVSSTQPFVPAVPGFVKRTLSWPADGPRKFARVKVELAE